MNLTSASLLSDAMEENLTVLANGSLLDVSLPVVSMPDPVIKLAHDILICVLLISVMFAMGCHITWNEVWNHLSRPIGVVIGMLSQFCLLPLSAFIIILLLRLDPLYATGMLVLACSPGGVTSNIFSYFCDGDISLSVTMTTCSTVAALAMMPLNMWVYGQWLETGALTIPYSKMSISLASVTAPVGAGMLFRWKFPNAAPYITKIGSYCGFAIIFICQTMELIIFPDIFDGIGWQFYVALVILPFIGLSLGYGLAFICRQPPPVRKTIAIECSIQNIGTALTVISLSFPVELQKKILAFPWLYSLPLITTVTVTCCCYQLYKRTCFKNRFGSCEKKLNGLAVHVPIPVVEKVMNDKPEEMQSFIQAERLTTV
ncbi:ileal sodium/bile acid cotransporter isoform X1 [Parasteatoda tepidariorum]|nr:ileal sodium/bile acid cotransporter isoform X1 [Parasteatoda tepidariorum]XP_042907367.1 ileal sodium/bile acid cotransporter isoform X1 [Parasteatoda tepidariorum]XP_042907378.1 ileal sodium/bile acid cotransporter isoform X1 [Parasteatoda tepidariorum]